MPIISKMTSQPACYAEIEAALVLFATLVEPAELRRVLRRIAHPAAVRATELRRRGAMACLRRKQASRAKIRATTAQAAAVSPAL